MLTSNGVECMLVGGYAVIYYGYTRTTGDMELWIAVSPANAQRVADTVRQFGFTSGINANAFLQQGKMFRMGMPPIRIELLTVISGIDFPDAYSRAVDATIDGISVKVIGLADLRANKRASGRAKDQADLANLP
ncbi:MAG TPA: nucleotidyltransferase [Tepidisphaeraceae bacterium]|nr:nucleotidyltransferase [Tepidisphaeraceae bacterium]